MRSTTLTLALLAALFALENSAASQSLWQKGRRNHVALVADNRAHRVGDVVTIVVDERQKVSNKENVKLEKTSKAKAEIPSFTPDQELADEIFPIEWNYEREFEGKGNFDKQGDFATRITATVIDIQPNGNLIVEGKRKVVLDKEEKWMTITGTVRSFDVESDNTVSSTLVANARVTYESCGPLARTTKPGWLEVLLDFFWPF